jgi:hypothetical protein
MRGTFNPEAPHDYKDGHVVLDAQQQMAHVEQMRHQEQIEFQTQLQTIKFGKPIAIARVRNPLLTEETRRTGRKGFVPRIMVKTPQPRHLVGSTFILESDLSTERRETMKYTRQTIGRDEQKKMKAYASKDVDKKEREKSEIQGVYDEMRGGEPASSARDKLQATQSSIGGGGLTSHTTRPQSAYASSSRSQDNRGPSTSSARVEAYFQSARESARGTDRGGIPTGRSSGSARPQTAGASSRRSQQQGYTGRSATGRSEYEIQPSARTPLHGVRPGSARPYQVEARPESNDSPPQTPSYHLPQHQQQNHHQQQQQPAEDQEIDYMHFGRNGRKPLVHSNDLKKLSLKHPKEAGAVRAMRAERFLDDKWRKTKNVGASLAGIEIGGGSSNIGDTGSSSGKRPSTAGSGRPVYSSRSEIEDPQATQDRSSTSIRPGTAPSSRKYVPNPGNLIPEGGNYKAVGVYPGNELSKSQLPAPWATHFHVYEKFPEKKLTAKEREELKLQNKVRDIRQQLADVEEELAATRIGIQGRKDEKYAKMRKSGGGEAAATSKSNQQHQNQQHQRQSTARLIKRIRRDRVNGTTVGSGKGIMKDRTANHKKFGQSNGGFIEVSRSARAFIDNI